MACLTLLGSASIQTYIFRSNRLRENLGASGLVGAAMRWWTKSNYASNVLYVAGGNAALRFPSKDMAKAAVGVWSTRMVAKAPGLRLVVAHVQYNDGELAIAFEQAQKALFLAENRAPQGIEPGALSIVRRCPSTGLAASEKAEPITDLEETEKKQTEKGHEEAEEEDEEDELQAALWLSAEAQAKRRYFLGAFRHEMKQHYRPVLRAGDRRYQFPRDFDRIGTTAGASQIALIHADGNGVGSRFSKLIEEHKNRRNDDAFIADLKELSDFIGNAGKKAFLDLVSDLVAQIPILEKKPWFKLRRAANGAYALPLRPIVNDGDDLTFVCHGKLGLSLTVKYLELFEKHGKDKGLDASAGVTVMPQKFPFAQAYAIADQLAGSAKRMRRHKGQGSWIDFHLQMEGRMKNLDTYRKSQYPNWLSRDGQGRPYRLGTNDSWEGFDSTWSEMIKWPRGEAKGLLEALASGRVEFEHRKNYLRTKSTSLSVPSENAILFDALEFLDFHTNWPPTEEPECSN